ncbi:cyclic nucleotide-binding domain protein (macronuclear) [Tetrahymena thermophila SB210]|uniref:Cyclic nucleotide-binding domain protein n=1 Tax=Tetrahymena thermophila (strain SB210) TaxID=312017 RepID=I7MMQ5_TETTS|nr:cyclic nucleotide-binding domain protein [Tetrahymena thermophila SB210]EAS06207.2 cyclic nucleotide-binding domain protein [Tetrahymena thermophila SB210]|eukprot:XP_001026452.2 cyclic nucleotide-binding domain protein [Tetrahymena thermophila SB210]
MNEQSSLTSQFLTENVNLKTATFQELSPEQSYHKVYSSNFDNIRKEESAQDLKEQITRLDLFINSQDINFSQIQVEKVNEDKVIFSQDNKVEYWFFIIEGSVRLSYNPLKFPQVSAELQDVIQFFDYAKLRDSPQLSFTFCKSQAQSPIQRSQSENAQYDISQKEHTQNIDEKEKKEVEISEQYERSNQTINNFSIKKSEIKSKKDLTLKNSQSLILKKFQAGDIITFKELKYYTATGTCSKGSTVLKIGISQVSNLKIYTQWQNFYRYTQNEQETFEQQQQQQYDYNQNINNANTAFEETFSESIEKYKFIKSIPLFQQLNSDIIDQSFNLINYKQGDVVFKEQELAQYFYIILEGEVELLKSSNPVNSQNISRSPSLSPKKNFSSTSKLNSYIKASVLSHGSIFGEEEVILQSVRNFTARVCSKRLIVYQLSIFFFLDYICRQNDLFYEKLKLMMQNKLAWRNNQIDSIQKVQKRLNQIEISNKSNSNLLKNTQVNDLTHVASDQSLVMKIPHNKQDQSAQNSPDRKQKRASSHLRMEPIPLKIHPKMAANPFILPQISDLQQTNIGVTRNQSKDYNSNQVIQPQMINTQRKNKSSQSNYKDVQTIKNSIDSEESKIKKNLRRKQNIISMFKKNNSILTNNRFPSFEKPLIPVDGYGLAVKSKNKFLLSSSKQHSRNVSQPSIDYINSLENSFCEQQINQKIKNKLIQNTSNLNISLNSQPSNKNFEKLMNDIEVDALKDQTKISQIVLPMQKQLTQISQNSNQQIPYINFKTNTNTRAVSRNSFQKLGKEQNRSMDDIYSQIDKLNLNTSLITTTMDNEATRIHSFRNSYINDNQFQDNSARNSKNELSPTQIGSLIDKNYKIYQKLGTYFRPSKNYLMNKYEKPVKGKKVQNFSNQQDLTTSFQQNEQLQGVQQNLKPLYNSLEKYRLLEKSPSQDNQNRKSKEYNQIIRDKIENYINDQLGTMTKKYKLIKEPDQNLEINQEMISLGVLNKNSPINSQAAFKREIANKLLSHNPSVGNTPTNLNDQAQFDYNFIPKSERYKQSSSLQKQKRYSNNSNVYVNNSCLQSSTCDCRFCIPHYKQNTSKSELRYQLQQGGCSLQHTNKKNLIIKKTTQLVNINYPQLDQNAQK